MSKQWSKAYLHFDEGCSAERSNANLHSNAAMAAIKMGCYAQAIEHCEKVIRLHDFLLEKPEHPMVVKAWQRMAAARVGLKHFKEAAEVRKQARQFCVTSGYPLPLHPARVGHVWLYRLWKLRCCWHLMILTSYKEHSELSKHIMNRKLSNTLLRRRHA